MLSKTLTPAAQAKIFGFLRLYGAKGVILGGATLLASPVGYSWWLDNQRTRRIDKSFDNGSFPKPQPMIIPRGPLLADLNGIIAPSPVHSFLKKYGLVSGNHGTGKTTAVRNTADEIGSGVVYFEVPAEVEAGFAEELGKTIGFTFDENLSGWVALKSRFLGQELPVDVAPTTLGDGWRRWKRQFEAGAERYRKKTGKVPTLIIDSVNRLAGPADVGASPRSPLDEQSRREKLLATIQESAKDWADNQQVRVVFVSSTGGAQLFLQGAFCAPVVWSLCYDTLCGLLSCVGRGAWSRCLRPFEVEDVGRDDSVSFMKTQGVVQAVAEQAFQVLLSSAASFLIAAIDFSSCARN